MLAQGEMLTVCLVEACNLQRYGRTLFVQNQDQWFGVGPQEPETASAIEVFVEEHPKTPVDTAGGIRIMKKETLGQVLKQRREAYALTQRELARKLGVKASHIAYLENGRRRPSLSLLSRLAETLELNKQRLFLLTHPEAEGIIGARHEPSSAKRPESAWRKFVGNRGMLARHKVTDQELKVLRQVNMLGRVSAPSQFLFILNSIRQAVEEE